MITVVSGLPRSGTSLMMQMLTAGGIEPLTDGQRAADANNPRGYYELESIKSLAKNAEVIAAAEGKVVKVISSLLMFLPTHNQYRIVFMCRPLDEVLSSQDRMLERLGKEIPSTTKNEPMAKAFEQHLKQIRGWLSEQPNMAVHYVDYSAILEDAHRQASAISNFLDLELDVDAMTRKVEHSLHREKARA
jgi:Sulfotransferase domain